MARSRKATPAKRSSAKRDSAKRSSAKRPTPQKGKSDVNQRDVDRLQKQGLKLEEAADELGVAPSTIANAYYLAEVNNDPDLAIEGTERAIAKGIVAQRKQGVRWVRLAARSGLSQARVKAIWEEETGIPANETWTGRGAPPPGMDVEEAREIAHVQPTNGKKSDGGSTKRSTAKRGEKTAPAKRGAAKRSSAKSASTKRGKARTRAERLAKSSGKGDPS